MSIYELTDTDKIWNRACQGGGDSPRPGDIALAGLLLFHSPAMNGGFIHAVDCLSPEELVAAKAGYKYFGFGGVADLIGYAKEANAQDEDVEPLEAAFDQRYWALVPDDDVLFQSFKRHQEQFPLEYLAVVE